MWDKFDHRIPFKADKVHYLRSTSLDKPVAYVDFKKYSFPKHAPHVEIGPDGQIVVPEIKSQKWESISSAIAGLAVGFFPQGYGFDTFPHVRIKASPAKILQGHNVFGSENSKHGIIQMFAMLQQAFPDIYEHLDISESEICYNDATYSARIRDFFSNKVFSSFESLAKSRQKIHKDSDYLLLGAESEYTRCKLYKKLQQVLADLQDAIRSRNQYKIDILSDKRLLDFSVDLHRFEATTGKRRMQDLGIPTNTWEFIKFEQKFLSDNSYSLCRYLWKKAFDPLFAQFEGHKMTNVDDSNIKLQIDSKHIRIKDNGKVCRRLANAVFKTYRDIKNEGYLTLSKLDNKTFFRNVKLLEEAGISRAFLKSLHPDHPESNVVPFIQFIKIDFNNQRPDWYVEPVAEYSKNVPERLLKLAR